MFPHDFLIAKILNTAASKLFILTKHAVKHKQLVY